MKNDKGCSNFRVVPNTHTLATRSAVLNVGASSTNDIICTTTKIYIIQKNASNKEKIDHLAPTKPQKFCFSIKWDARNPGAAPLILTGGDGV